MLPSQPEELKGDPRRQAVALFRGLIYQGWWSIDAWLRIRDDEQVIYLEGAEDFDIVGGASEDVTVQVKDNAGSLSLGNAKAHEALENFWSLAEREPARTVHMHYLTTSEAVTERDGAFGGMKGIEAWRAARTNAALANEIAAYLVTKLEQTSALRQFLVAAPDAEVQERLFTRFYWFTGQPGIEAVQRSVDDRLAVLLSSLGRPVRLVDQVRVHLESRFWEVVREPQSSMRFLTRGDLLRRVDEATTTYLPVPVESLRDLFSGARPGAALLALLREKVPRPPSPLIPRDALAGRLKNLVEQRRAVLLTGTVYKGKTTVAQLVAALYCPEAWWLPLSGRTPDQVDTLLLALASEIEEGSCPSLIVIDDLDIGPLAHRVYGTALSLVMHRALNSGRGIILTAQGATSAAADIASFPDVEVVDVPELAMEEVGALCIAHGCAAATANMWGFAIHLQSRGHPKLVQVRLLELEKGGWPAFDPSRLGADSPATQSVKHLTRLLLSESVSPAAAELVYAVSVAGILLHRIVIVRLAELLGVQNAGDVVDALTGTWLERIEANWFRCTSLLQGTTSEVWSPARKLEVHVVLHQAILSKGTLSPDEAAALLFHAYFGQDWARVAGDSMRLQLLKGDEVQREVERNLLWLPYVALDSGSRIAGDGVAGAALRSMQFRVAVTLDTDTLPSICDRWIEEARTVPTPILESMQVIMWGAFLTSDTPKVPLHHRLAAVRYFAGVEGDVAILFLEGAKHTLRESGAGIPETGTPTQLMLSFLTRWVRDADSLQTLVHWLEHDATDGIRAEFELVLAWPLVKTMGAFVHSAWATRHDQVTDWAPWLALFDQIQVYGKSHASIRFGVEAAKAKSIVLSENLGRSDEALLVLVDAELEFGPSPVLQEQRANVLFQDQDDEAVLKIWSEFVESGAAKTLNDSYAYRRAAISAARLERWELSAQMFRGGAGCAEAEGFETTRFGMLVDCALVELLGGQSRKAVQTLQRAVAQLPGVATHDDGERWEPLQRIASEVCTLVEAGVWKEKPEKSRIQPGDASSPGQKYEKTEPGQALRSLLLRVRCATVAAMHGVVLVELEAEIDVLAKASYRLVRWSAAEATLARALALDGLGFPQALIRFDLELSGMLAARGDKSLMLAPDVGGGHGAATGSAWLGLVVAGTWVAGAAEGMLTEWARDLESQAGFSAAGEVVRQVLAGALAPANTLGEIVADPEMPTAVRCGAAIKLLDRSQPPHELLRLHGLLVSALVSQDSSIVQKLWNLSIARRLSSDWHALAESPFNFSAPRSALPPLRIAIAMVERGQGTAKTIFAAAHRALDLDDPECLGRLL